MPAAETAAPVFGLIIVGDEILSGKRADKHLPKVIELLAARGLRLDWAEYVGDDPARITAALRRALASGDVVFCTGGIGATPDDHTRQCAAVALGVPLALHPEAKALIEERMQDVAREKGEPYEPDRADNQHRLNMGVFPQGARIIPNPYNKIPGFALAGSAKGAHPAAGPLPRRDAAPSGGSAACEAAERGGDNPAAGPLPRRDAAPSGGSAPRAAGERGGMIYFLPGFPVMAWPMIEWALDTDWSHAFQRTAWVERSVILYGSMEATLTPVMQRVEAAHPDIKVFSLPSVDHPQHGAHIELGVKGPAAQAEAAYVDLRAWLQPFDLRYGPELVR
jgi:molybdopterin-biosynthesis enzyme MoeA-like protein